MDGTARRARRALPLRTAKACGPGLPTLRLSGQNDLLAMGAIKPGPRGERAISRKPLRREGRIAPSSPVVPSPCFFMHGGRGCGGHPAFPAPSDAEGGTQAKLRAQIAPRECCRLSKL